MAPTTNTSNKCIKQTASLLPAHVSRVLWKKHLTYLPLRRPIVTPTINSINTEYALRLSSFILSIIPNQTRWPLSQIISHSTHWRGRKEDALLPTPPLVPRRPMHPPKKTIMTAWCLLWVFVKTKRLPAWKPMAVRIIPELQAEAAVWRRRYWLLHLLQVWPMLVQDRNTSMSPPRLRKLLLFLRWRVQIPRWIRVVVQLRLLLLLLWHHRKGRLHPTLRQLLILERYILEQVRPQRLPKLLRLWPVRSRLLKQRESWMVSGVSF